MHLGAVGQASFSDFERMACMAYSGHSLCFNATCKHFVNVKRVSVDILINSTASNFSDLCCIIYLSFYCFYRAMLCISAVYAGMRCLSVCV